MKKTKKPPAPPGAHFSTAELLAIRSASERLAWNVEVRLIHHLALPCAECWAAVRALPPLVNGEARCREPVVRALCRFAMPAEDLTELSQHHRRALAEACDWPLAFCELLLDEAWLVVEEWSDTPADDLYDAFGPIGGNGVCLLAPRLAHDLQARFYDFLSAAYRDVGDDRRAENAAAVAESHRARGPGGEEPAGQAGTSKTVNGPGPSKTAKPKKRRST